MRNDARYHLMASVHHAAKASAYGKLGYHEDQVRHAVRALDHKLMFGAGQYDPGSGFVTYPVDNMHDDYDGHDHDIYGDDPDTMELGRIMNENHGHLYPHHMRHQPPRVVYTHADEEPVRVSSRSHRVPVASATVPLRAGSSLWDDATAQLQGMRRVPVAGVHELRDVNQRMQGVSLHAPPPLRAGSLPWDASPHVPVTLQGVFVKLDDFFRPWQERAEPERILRRRGAHMVMRELNERPDLSSYNNGKPVTMSTPLPASVIRPIIEQFLKSRLAAWDKFVENAEALVRD